MEGNLQSVLKVVRMEVTQNRGLTLVQLMFYLTLMMKLLKILDSVKGPRDVSEDKTDKCHSSRSKQVLKVSRCKVLRRCSQREMFNCLLPSGCHSFQSKHKQKIASGKTFSKMFWHA